MIEVKRSAVLSPCQRYRYLLTRSWSDDNFGLAFIGLNPSTADHEIDDPTIRRCIGFAKSWGYGGFVMLNAYAFRATDPRDLFEAEDPVGPSNDSFLRYFGYGPETRYIACWGTKIHPEREKKLIGMKLGLWCFGKTKNGHPKHPLYLRKDTEIEPYNYKTGSPDLPENEDGEE